MASKRVLLWVRALLFGFVLSFLTMPEVMGQAAVTDGPPGITVPTVLPPFNPDAPGCTQPPELQGALVFAQDNEREFMQGVGRGLSLAAAQRGMQFSVELANNRCRPDAGTSAGCPRVAGRCRGCSPVDAPSLARSLQELIWQGSYVGTIVPPPRYRC